MKKQRRVRRSPAKSQTNPVDDAEMCAGESPELEEGGVEDTEFPEGEDEVPGSKKKRGRPPGAAPHIQISASVWITADAYNWVLVNQNRHSYHSNLLSLFQALFEAKVRESQVKTLEELSDAVISARVEIMDQLRPFCTWNGQNIHVLQLEDFLTTARKNG